MFVSDPGLEVGSSAPFDIVDKKGDVSKLLLGVYYGEADHIRVAYGLFEVGEDGLGFLDERKLFFENG